MLRRRSSGHATGIERKKQSRSRPSVSRDRNAAPWDIFRADSSHQGEASVDATADRRWLGLVRPYDSPLAGSTSLAGPRTPRRRRHVCLLEMLERAMNIIGGRRPKVSILREEGLDQAYERLGSAGCARAQIRRRLIDDTKP